MGRKNTGDTRSTAIWVRVTPTEKALIEKVAKNQFVDTSTWCRQQILMVVEKLGSKVEGQE